MEQAIAQPPMEDRAVIPAKGAHILVEALAREGVTDIFGYPGGASMEIHQALTRHPKQPIRLHLPRHEQGGGFMAQGYARATGKVGVALATSGPGATNLVTPIADAMLDSIPCVFLTGQVPLAMIGKDAFQETDITGITRPITKHNYLVRSIDDLPRIVQEAFYIARTGRPGPVLIDIPKNVQQSMGRPVFPERPVLRGYHPDRRAADDDLDRAAEAVRGSRRPVIYMGGGVIHADAGDAVRRFAERTGVPIVSTVMGLGGVPGDHPLFYDMLGMHGAYYANWAVAQADLLLAFGVRFDDRVTGKLEAFCKHGKIVHIDIDASEINKNKYADIGIVGDVRDAVERLLERFEDEDRFADWRAQIDEVRKERPYYYDRKTDKILPQYVLERLSEKTRGDAVLTTGVGQHQMWTAQWYKFRRPRSFLTSAGLGSMGFGLPAAIGAAIARPEELVIDIDGDGSFVMNVQELALVYSENIPVKVLILNNQHLGMVVQWEDRFYDSNRGHTFIGDARDPKGIHPDFVKIAEGFKIPAKRITKKAEVDAALDEMLSSDGPFVLDVIVPYQEHVLPMIPAGKTFDDLIYE